MSNPPWKKPDGNKPPAPAPWMKNNKAADNGTPTPPPPPAMGGGFVPPSKPNPPAMNPSAGGGSQPWMQNKNPPSSTGQSFQPPSFKPPSGQPASSGPLATGAQPWMKNKAPGFTPPNQHNAEQEARKKEEQENKRKQEQRQKQIIQQKKQLQLMKFEEQHSKIREQEDQQNQLLNKKNKGKGSKGKKGSPIKKINSPNKQKKIKIGNTFFHKYIQYLGLSCSRNQQYDEKIDHQKNILKTITQFTDSCRQKLGEYLSQRKIITRKKNCINLQNLFIEYGLIETSTIQAKNQENQKSVKIVYKTKKIEQMEKTFCLYQVLFNIIIKLLKKTTIFRIRVPLMSWVSFKGLEFLCQGICEDLADSPSSVTDNYPEISGQLTQVEKELNNLGYGFLNRKNFVIKKIVIGGEDLFILYFSENLHSMIYNENFSYNANKFYPNYPLTVDKLTNLDHIFSQNLPINYSQIHKLKQIMKNSTIKMNQFLNLFLVAHSIRLVYASCQGQVEEESFWDLVFDGNPQVWGLIERCYQSYFTTTFLPFSFEKKQFLADILQLMVPIKFGVKKFKLQSPSNSRIQKKKLTMLNHSPKVYIYPLENLQLIQIVNLFKRNLERTNRITLAEQSIQTQEEIRKISNNLIISDLQFLKNRIQFHLKVWEINKNSNQQKAQKAARAYDEGMRLLEDYTFKKGKEKEKFIIFPLLLTVYMINQHPKQVKESKNQQQDQEQEQKPQKMPEEQEENEEIVKEIKKSAVKKDYVEKKQGNQTKMLKVLAKLLQSLGQYLGSDQENWFHAGIYLLVSEYYSRKTNVNYPLQLRNEAESFSKSQAINHNSLNASEIHKVSNLEQSMPISQKQSYQSLVNSIQTDSHPHYEQCMKFLEHAHSIFLQYYGTYSFELADMLVQKALVLLNVGEFNKGEDVIEQALKIYKSSSKHASAIYQSQFILGKCIVEQGKKQQNQRKLDQGRRLIQKTGHQFLTLSMHAEAIQAFQYLYTSLQPRSRFVQKQSIGETNLAQEYLQKIAEVALNCHICLTLKNIIKKVMQQQASIYSKQKMKIIQDLRSQVDDTLFQDENEIDQIFLSLQEEAKTFGGFIQMMKWSLRVLQFKADSYEWQRAAEIMRNLLSLFDKEEIPMIF